jgi:F420-dependent oxidoreductase-like protein
MEGSATMEDRMRFVLMIEAQQGLSYGDQLGIATRAEANGFEAFFRSDHYASFPGPAGHPTTDAWTVLAGLARETDRIGLGVLVSPVTFRHPGSFAKVVTTVDEMSGGRIEVGVGAGWNEVEHRQLGLPFPPIAERADRLEDQLAILHGLWGDPDGWSFAGRHTSVEGALFHPKPVDVPGRPRTPVGGARPRIIVGGEGSPRSLRIAARHADEFNVTSSSPDTAAAVQQRLDEACAAIGRDPATLARSAMVGVLVGRDATEVRRRETALLDALGTGGGADAGAAWLAERRTRWIMGTPEEARATVGRFAAVGIERIMLQDFLPRDLDMIDVMGEELVGRV